MNFLPKEIEEIIIDYKCEIEKNEKWDTFNHKFQVDNEINFIKLMVRETNDLIREFKIARSNRQMSLSKYLKFRIAAICLKNGAKYQLYINKKSRKQSIIY